MLAVCVYETRAKNSRFVDCKSKLHFTNKHSKAKIVVSHLVRIVMRVGRLDEDSPDSKVSYI